MCRAATLFLQDYLSADAAAFAAMPWAMQQSMPDEGAGGGYSSSELNAPEYSSDDFRMFSFKVARCGKRYVHDWRACPFAHPTENARRRDPRHTRYLPVPCPDYKRGICLRGDSCPYSHGVYECWLHPAKYRTQLCKEGPHCRRPVCFFAHSVSDLRQPTHLWNSAELAAGAGPGAAAGPAPAPVPQQAPSAAAALMQVHANGSGGTEDSASVSAVSSLGARSESDASRRLQSVEEALNNMNAGGNSSSDGGWGSSGNASANNNANNGPANVKARPASPPLVAAPAEATANASVSVPNGSSAAGDDSTPSTPLHASEDAAQAPPPKAQTAAAPVPVTPAVADLASPTGAQTQQQQQVAGSPDKAANPDGSWPQGLATSAAVAVALSGIPVNEQPLLTNQGPRMSNAVARKLGLAPARPPAPAAPAPAPAPVNHRAHSGALPSPHRMSLDGLTMPQIGGYPQVPGRASADYPPTHRGDVHVSSELMGLGGAGSPLSFNAQSTQSPFLPGAMGVGGLSASYPGAGPDALGIHPALLNLVAANMGAGQQIMVETQGQPMHGQSLSTGSMGLAGMQSLGVRGDLSTGTMPSDAMASLINSMGQWSVGQQGQGQGGVSDRDAVHVPHRGSSEGMLGVSGMPQVRTTPKEAHVHGHGTAFMWDVRLCGPCTYESCAVCFFSVQVPQRNAYQLPSDLFNNQAGGTDC